MSTLKVDTITDSSSGLTTTINGFTPNLGNMVGKNIIINGDMLIAQRGTSAVTTSASFPVDRWKCFSNASDFSAQQSSVVPSGQEFTKSVHITPTSTKAHSGSDYFFFSQYVEGYSIRGLGYGTSGAKTITISFWVRSSKTGTYCVGMKNSVANRSRQNEYTISVADTWEKKTIVVPGDTTGSWPIDNTRGVAIEFILAGQNTATGSANTWLPNNSNMSTNQVNFFDNTSNNFYITGVQVEVGSEATDFEHRPFGTELALCQRYYTQRNGSRQGSYSPCMVAYSTTAAQGTLTLATTMRTNPSVSFTQSFKLEDGAAGYISSQSSFNGSSTSVDSINFWIGGFTGLTDGYPYYAYGSGAGAVLKIEAEL